MATILSLRRILAGVAALALAFFIVPASAQMPQVALTSATVEAFIASYPDVKAASDTLKAKYGDPSTGGDATSSWTAWMAVGGATGALNTAVQAHGFNDFQSWLSVLTSVGMAYGFAKDGGEMDQGIADAIKQIQNDPNMSDAQKQMMLQQMQAAMGSVAAMRPSQENIDAVKPYVDQLQVVFN